MLLSAEITDLPLEQDLIDQATNEFAPLYPKWPYHNIEHSHDEALPEALRLDNLNILSPAPSNRRLLVIIAVLGHDILEDVELDPQEGFKTKEQRAGVFVGNIMPSFGFKKPDIQIVQDSIECTGLARACKTEIEKTVSRGDLKNIRDPRLYFLSNTVKLFYEKLMTATDEDKETLSWPSFIREQDIVLRQLLSQDLMLGFEKTLPGGDRFRKKALRNINWLSTDYVLDPTRFIKTYGRKLGSLLPMFSGEDIIDPAAS